MITSIKNHIPKQLFFIWIGDDVPNYAKTSMNAFKQVNPDFEVTLLQHTDRSLERVWNGSESDPPFKRALERILQDQDSYVQWQASFYGQQLSFNQLLSDIARLEVLNQYGGIYLDLDTFPIARFDDKLLANDFFVVKRKSRGMNQFLDNFFLGKAQTENQIQSPYNVQNSYLVDDTMPFMSSPEWLVLQKKFFDGSLVLGEHILPASSYVDHYSRRTWKNHIETDKERWYDKIWRR